MKLKFELWTREMGPRRLVPLRPYGRTMKWWLTDAPGKPRAWVRFCERFVADEMTRADAVALGAQMCAEGAGLGIREGK